MRPGMLSPMRCCPAYVSLCVLICKTGFPIPALQHCFGNSVSSIRGASPPPPPHIEAWSSECHPVCWRTSPHLCSSADTASPDSHHPGRARLLASCSLLLPLSTHRMPEMCPPPRLLLLLSSCPGLVCPERAVGILRSPPLASVLAARGWGECVVPSGGQASAVSACLR